MQLCFMCTVDCAVDHMKRAEPDEEGLVCDPVQVLPRSHRKSLIRTNPAGPERGQVEDPGLVEWGGDSVRNRFGSPFENQDPATGSQ